MRAPTRFLLPWVLVLVFLPVGCGTPGVALPRPVSVFLTGFMRGQIRDYGRRRGMGHRQARVFGGADRLQGLLESSRRRVRDRGTEPLTLDLGDFLSGSPEAQNTQGKSSAAVMQSRSYDAILLGNREFTFGQEVLYDFSDSRRLPLVTSNLDLGTALPPVLGNDFGPVSPPGFARRRIDLEAPPGWAGLPISILGLTPENLMDSVEPEHRRGLVFCPDLRARLEDLVRSLPPGPRIVILLTQDDVMAKKGELRAAVEGLGIDLVLGFAYGRTARAYSLDSTWVAGIRNDLLGSALARFDLDLDPRLGRIQSLRESYRVAVARGEDAPAPSPKVESALRPFRRELESLEEVVARTEVPLHGTYHGESTLGNLVADALHDADPNADAVVVSAGVLGQDLIPAGPIRKRELFSMFQYENFLVRLEVPGDRLRQAFEELVRDRARVLISGIRYAYQEDPDHPTLVRLEVQGGELDPKKTYTVLMNSFTHRRNRALTDLPATKLGDCRSQIEASLRSRGTVHPRIEGRVEAIEWNPG